MQPPPPRTGKTLLQALAPFGMAWTALFLLLVGLWWRSELRERRELAVARAQTAFRLERAYHLGRMQTLWTMQERRAAGSRAAEIPFVLQIMDPGDLAGRLTSLQPGMGQVPDSWERSALERMAGGAEEVVEVVPVHGRSHLRFMGGLRMGPACVECHAGSGVAQGQLLGGLSYTLPAGTILDAVAEPMQQFILAFFVAGWAAVLATMSLARHRQRRATELASAATRTLKDSEERLQEALRIASMGYWEHDHRTGRIHWSEGLYRIFGLDPGGAPPSFDAFMERVHPEDRVRIAELYQHHLRERQPYQAEFRILQEGGGVRHLLVHSHTEFDRYGTPLRTLGIDMDLTERRNLDEAVKAQAEAHRVLLQTSLDGCLEVDDRGRILEVNDAYLRLSGRSREQLVGSFARDLEATDDSGAVRAQTIRIRHRGMDRYETWHRGGDGRRIPLQVSVTYLPSQGRFLYIVRDLTAEREARQALAESEVMFAEVFRSSPYAIVVSDLAGDRILDLNPAFERMTGWSRESALGRSASELGLWADPAERGPLVAEVLEKGELACAQVRFRRRDGSRFQAEVRAVRLGPSHPPRALSMLREVRDPRPDPAEPSAQG